MPFALIIVGVVLIVSAVRNTTNDLFTLVKGDFTGDKNYTYWMVSILIIGSLGYVKALQPLSRIFLALVVVVLFLSNGSFFDKFNQQVFSSTGSTGSTGLSGSGIPSGGIDLGKLATPQPWVKENTPIPSNLGIETPLSSGRNN